jgi:hypothetical protein
MRIRIRNTEWRINALQQHYQARNKRRRPAEQDEEVRSAPQAKARV